MNMLLLPKEIWRYTRQDKEFEVSSEGRVKTNNFQFKGKERILKLTNTRGYRMVSIRQKNYFVHRLVWEAFYGVIPNDKEIDHINGNPSDNRIVNLRCVSHKENCYNPVTSEKHKIAVKKARRKRVLQTDLQGKKIACYDSLTIASNKTGINRGNIGSCCQCKRKTAGGHKWSYI